MKSRTRRQNRDRFVIVSIGRKLLPGTQAIGGDRKLWRKGFTCEVTDLHGPDGGPVTLGGFRSPAQAEVFIAGLLAEVQA